MRTSKLFQYALLALVLGPLVVATTIGVYSQTVTTSSSVTTGPTKVTVNTPPNDVVGGPTVLNSTGNVGVSTQGAGSTGIDIRGTATGMVFNFQGSVDGTNYVNAPCVVPATGALVTGGTANGTWTCQSAGYQLMRVNMTALASGSATITLNASAGSNQPPIGIQGTATNITAVGGNAVTTTVPVSGTVSIGSATVVQPTASNLNATVAQPTAANLNATVVQSTAANLNATVTGTVAATQSGSWTMNGAVNVTLTDCSGSVATGGTAQNAFAANAGRHGFTIANIDTNEVMWISFTGTAAASGTASYPLAPATASTFAGLNSFTSPFGMGINTALSIIAATTSHKYSCTVW